MHDQDWTGLPMLPQDDPQPRELHPPSTAATLNLAAAGGPGARLFAPYDPAFAARCLTAAQTAYAAAQGAPGACTPEASDGTGGGAYDDGDVTDEFYWAAAELYLTTGEAAYLADADRPRRMHTGDVFTPGGFGWGCTAALGRLDLATVPSGLPGAERHGPRSRCSAPPTGYLATLRGQAYGLPMPGDAGAYFWGSNSNIINNAVVLATAYDLTGDGQVPRRRACRAMDYILGRNALNQSYVTGYGENALAEPAQPDLRPPARPVAAAPAGRARSPAAPNAGLAGPGRAEAPAPAASRSSATSTTSSRTPTNEVAINWNSALAWMASFLADQGTAAPAAGRLHGAATSTTAAGRTGRASPARWTSPTPATTAVDGWTLRFAFTGDQVLREAWMAKATQSGATVTAHNETYNRRIQPGATVMFGFNATTALGLAKPATGAVHPQRRGLWERLSRR